jgi:hypothetical protein
VHVIIFLNLIYYVAHIAGAMNALASIIKGDHCSALIKVLPGNTDVLFSHVTWTSYATMIRIWKSYTLPFQVNDRPAATSVAFTSYPLMVWSVDDFYINSAHLAIMETTNSVYDASLYKRVNPTQVLTWLRAALSARLSSSGPQWAQNFQRYATGTYANQWIVFDYNRFVPGRPLLSDALWVIEELPGIHSLRVCC